MALTEYRIDTGGNITTKLDANGYLRVDGIAAKTGVLTYVLADGTIQRELVPDDTLFNEESLSSLIGAPVTIEHPAILTPDNAVDFARGSVPVAKADDGKLRVGLVVTGKDAIESIKSGKQQLSPGYRAELDFTPGEYNGQKYDAVQVKRVYNHLAIVQSARGGSECKINLDGFNCAVEVKADQSTTNEVLKMPTVKLRSGATVEVADASTATALQTEINTLATKADSIDTMIEKSKYDELQGKCDSLQDEIKKLKEAADQKLDSDDIGSYVETVEKAKKLKADIEIKADGVYLDKSQIMAAALGIEAKDKSAEYIQGRFDSALDLLSADNVRKQRDTRTDSTERTSTGREKFMAEQLKRGA